MCQLQVLANQSITIVATGAQHHCETSVLKASALILSGQKSNPSIHWQAGSLTCELGLQSNTCIHIITVTKALSSAHDRQHKQLFIPNSRPHTVRHSLLRFCQHPSTRYEGGEHLGCHCPCKWDVAHAVPACNADRKVLSPTDVLKLLQHNLQVPCLPYQGAHLH